MLLFVRDNARWLAAGFLLTLPWFGRTIDQVPGWKVARFTMPALAAKEVLRRQPGPF